MIFQKITNWCLYTAAFLIPLFFLPFTLEPLEINKQTLLVVLILIACLANATQVLINGTLTIKKNVINYLLIIFLASLGISTIISGVRLLSWVGTSLQEYTSFLTVVVYVILLWLISGRTKETKIFNNLIILTVSGALIAGLIGLFSVFGIFLPISFAQTQTFNTIGTLNSLGFFLVAATVLANSFFIVWKGQGRLLSILTLALSTVTFVFLIALDYWIVWLVFLVGLVALLAMVFLRAHELHHTKKYLVSMLMAAGAVFFLIAPLPNLVSTPIEVTPNTQTSLSIAKQTMTGVNFWFGSGPGTYIFDYAKFRPAEVNQTNFWNTRFGYGSSNFLTTLPTWGLIPTTLLLLFVLILTVVLIKKFFQKEDDRWRAFILLPAFLTLSLTFFVYPSNFSLSFLFFLVCGLIYSMVGGKTKNFVLNKTPRKKIITTSAFALFSILIVTALFLVGERLAAETTFTKAIKTDRANGDLNEVTSLIDKAATINRFSDTYYRNLAETLYLTAESEAAKINSTQLTDEQSKYLQALIAASINAAKQAVYLESRNVNNWTELGSIYLSFSSVVNGSSDFAIEAFQTAINLEPNNPYNYLKIGKAYFAAALILGPDLTSENPATKTAAEAKQKELFASAETNFQKAIELKSDYANAHYELALLYEQEGRLDDAVAKMESISAYNPQDVGVAFELGILYLRRAGEEDLDKAETILKQAIEVLPSYSNAHWYLAFVYEQKNDTASAITEVEKVLELNPDNEMVKTGLERLKNSLITPNVPEETPVEPIE